MPNSTTIQASTDSYGEVHGSNASFATARGTAAWWNINSGTSHEIGMYLNAGTYWVYRGFVKFNTSSLNGANITSVTMTLTCTIDNTSTNDFNLQIIKNNWSSSDPLTAYAVETPYDNALSSSLDNDIWRSTSGMSTNTPYTSGQLDTTWINTSGNTYYSFTSDRDRNNTTPTGNEIINLASPSHGTSNYRPTLNITYTYQKTLQGIQRSNVKTLQGIDISNCKTMQGIY